MPKLYHHYRDAAWHQAGHAVAGVTLGLPVEGVTLQNHEAPVGHSRGETDCPVQPAEFLGKGADSAVPYIAYSLAGSIAEGSVADSRSEGDARIDSAQANYRAVLALRETGDNSPTVSPPERENNADRIDKLLLAGAELADQVVREHQVAIDSVANALLRRIDLTGDEVAAIVGDG